MKVLAILLCVFVAVQGRSAGVKETKALAALGDQPWLVHLRIAVSTSGYLNSCAGSLIASNWVLTTDTCVDTARFIWIRYGAVNIINPELVTETSSVTLYESTSSASIALIAINRIVLTTDNIAPVSLVAADVPSSTSFCGYGDNDDNDAGEILSCFDVTLTESDDGTITSASDDGVTTEYDLGAPLVTDGVQIGVLVAAADDSSAGTFLAVADYVSWIEETTGLTLSSKAFSRAPDSLLVNVVN